LKTRTLESKLWLPLDIARVFAFFADAHNLDLLTPPWLHFQILTPPPIRLGAGALIDYRLKIHKVPVRWQSEITLWEPPHRFVDEQRRGPYKRWVHSHSFEARDQGTLIRDRVDYAVPGFVCEPLLHRFLVAPDLEAVFAFREQQIRTLLLGDGPV
jgi:ligand-binding SRPBCC domain-containing protein